MRIYSLCGITSIWVILYGEIGYYRKMIGLDLYQPIKDENIASVACNDVLISLPVDLYKYRTGMA